jgi:hypothetical protein
MTPKELLAKAKTLDIETAVLITVLPDGKLYCLSTELDYEKLMDIIRRFLKDLDT